MSTGLPVLSLHRSSIILQAEISDVAPGVKLSFHAVLP